MFNSKPVTLHFFVSLQEFSQLARLVYFVPIIGSAIAFGVWVSSSDSHGKAGWAVTFCLLTLIQLAAMEHPRWTGASSKAGARRGLA
ncbi:hypothetical protein BDZ88DRAFT_434018 [Geranomyces variabilis]|nr:hypothetical protein BDZ88DRAFT_434018 [Geranomyces variabilis]